MYQNKHIIKCLNLVGDCHIWLIIRDTYDAGKDQRFLITSIFIFCLPYFYTKYHTQGFDVDGHWEIFFRPKMFKIILDPL